MYRVTWISPGKGIKGKNFEGSARGGQSAINFGLFLQSKGFRGIVIKNTKTKRVIGTLGFVRKKKVWEI